MKVITLRGAENTGKSHVINMVYSFLLRDGYTQVPGNFRELGNPKFEDIIDILTKDDVLIGFVGMGDYQTGKGSSLKSLLEELKIKGCHIAICASRNNAKIISAVTEYPNHHIVDKTISSGSSNNRIVNVIDANSIIKNI
jgi:hypothetical protein